MNEVTLEQVKDFIMKNGSNIEMMDFLNKLTYGMLTTYKSSKLKEIKY